MFKAGSTQSGQALGNIAVQARHMTICFSIGAEIPCTPGQPRMGHADRFRGVSVRLSRYICSTMSKTKVGYATSPKVWARSLSSWIDLSAHLLHRQYFSRNILQRQTLYGRCLANSRLWAMQKFERKCRMTKFSRPSRC